MFVEMVPSLLKKSFYFIWHYIFFNQRTIICRPWTWFNKPGLLSTSFLRNHNKVNFVLVLHRYRVFELRASVLTSSGSGALSQELHQGFISQTTRLYNYCVFRPICIFFFTMNCNPSLLAYICFKRILQSLTAQCLLLERERFQNNENSWKKHHYSWTPCI